MRSSPRYPESTSPGVFTSVIPCFVASPSAAERSPRSRAGSRPRRLSRRARVRRARARRARTPRGRGRRRPRTRAAAAPRRAAAGGSAARRSAELSLPLGLGDMNGAKRTRSRRGSRARMKTPPACPRAPRRRAQRVQLCEPRPLAVRHEQPHLLEALARSARRCARAARRGPRRSARRSGVRPEAARQRRRASGSSRSTLFSTSTTAATTRRSRSARSRPRAAARRAVLRLRRVGDVERRGRRRASPRASRRSLRRADAAACG